MTGEDELRKALDMWGFPADATQWLCDMYCALQVFDDAADGDMVDRRELDRTIDWCLFGQMANPFFMNHATQLIPLIPIMIDKWQASDEAERNGLADERSYVWRAGFYDLILAANRLLGVQVPPIQIMTLYGETFAQYREEFPCQDPQ